MKGREGRLTVKGDKRLSGERRVEERGEGVDGRGSDWE